MANRQFQQYQMTSLKGVVYLGATVNIGATGAPTLQKWTPVGISNATGAYSAAPTSGASGLNNNASIGEQGVKSISRVSTGVYLLTLQDSYARLLDFHCFFSNATGLPTVVYSGVWSVGTNVTTSTGGTIKFTTMSSSATAADPASGDVMGVLMLLQSSTAI
jgi:hypothetical protein